MGIKTFALEKPIALQLACIGSRLMINYGTHVTIKIGCKVVEEYFDIADVEHYDMILGTPFLRKMGIVLDFRSPGMAQIGNKVIPTGKVSFDKSKDTDDNIATKGNIIQSSSAALDRELSQEGGPQEGPPERSPCSSKGKCPHPRMRTWGRSSIPLRGTSGHTRHAKIETLPGVDTDRCSECQDALKYPLCCTEASPMVC